MKTVVLVGLASVGLGVATTQLGAQIRSREVAAITVTTTVIRISATSTGTVRIHAQDSRAVDSVDAIIDATNLFRLVDTARAVMADRASRVKGEELTYAVGSGGHQIGGITFDRSGCLTGHLFERRPS